MAKPKPIYVICRDGGTQGFSAPIQASRRRDEAIALALLLQSEMIVAVFEVPMLPQYQSIPWFSLKRIWPGDEPR